MLTFRKGNDAVVQPESTTASTASASVPQEVVPASPLVESVPESTPAVTTVGCGVQEDGAVMCGRIGGDFTQLPGNLPGNLKYISVDGDRIYGVNSNDDLLYAKDYKNPNWVNVPGKLSQVSLDKNVVCGTTASNDIYCADENIETLPKWFKLPGALKNVSVSNGRLYGINSSDNIYFASNYKDAQWKQMPGALQQVSFDGNVVCGTNSASDIYCADKDIETAAQWFKVPGSLKQVSVKNGQLYGTNTANAVVFAPDYKNAQWMQTKERLKQVELN